MFGECLKRKRPWSIDCEDSPCVKVYISASHCKPYYSSIHTTNNYQRPNKRRAASPHSNCVLHAKKTRTEIQQYNTKQVEMNSGSSQKRKSDGSRKKKSSPNSKPSNKQDKMSSVKAEETIRVQGPEMEGPQEFNSYNYWKNPLPEVDIAGLMSVN